MEEGSLLQQALAQRDDALHNTLVVSVFCITKSKNVSEFMLTLADECVRLNRYLQQQHVYPWWSGGDGPVFGVHVKEEEEEKERIPHLRAHCRYGPCVADEWKLIGLLLQYTAAQRKKDRDVMLAVQCWDMDDGDVLLIQSAYELPSWVHHEGSVDEATLCRNRCWIVNGQVTLLEPESSSSAVEGLTYAQALQMMARNDHHLVSPAAIQRAIQSVVQSHVTNQQQQQHRAAVAVPRSVAHLLSKRPDLAAAACRAFYQQATSREQQQPLKQQQPTAVSNSNNNNSSVVAVVWEDWVWTTHSFGRAQYAMLRNLLAAPDYKTINDMPSRYRASPQVQRLQQQAAFEATPHLRAGVQVGVRLVAGLDYLLSSSSRPSREPREGINLMERRVLRHWSRILQCSDSPAGNDDKMTWLLQAWQAGPNNSAHNLEQLMQCPVFEEEIRDSLTPLSHPDQSVAEQIQRVLKEGSATSTTEYEELPRAKDVDSEEWMTMPTEDEMTRLLDPTSGNSSAERNEQEEGLGNMLGAVKTFLEGSSGVEGVSHDHQPSAESTSRPTINPTVFLNLLRATLQAGSVDEMASILMSEKTASTVDPFFSAEDYDLMEPTEDGQVDSLFELMQAMDLELQEQSSLSRAFDGPVPNADSHILSNFLESLEAGEGGPGPVRNIVGQLRKAPQLHEFAATAE